MTTPSAPQRWLRSLRSIFLLAQPPLQSPPQKRRSGCAGLVGFVPLSPKLTHDFLEDPEIQSRHENDELQNAEAASKHIDLHRSGGLSFGNPSGSSCRDLQTVGRPCA